MLGCASRLRTPLSRRKRSMAVVLLASPGAMILMATRLPVVSSTPRYTDPMAPEPSSFSTLNGPNCLPTSMRNHRKKLRKVIINHQSRLRFCFHAAILICRRLQCRLQFSLFRRYFRPARRRADGPEHASHATVRVLMFQLPRALVYFPYLAPMLIRLLSLVKT